MYFPMKEALLTSSFSKYHPLTIAMAKRTHTMAILATGENVS